MLNFVAYHIELSHWPTMLDSVITVSENSTCQAINMKKAAAICANTDNLTLCAAFDTVKGANILDQIYYNFSMKVLY